jgi:hypothetical protein
VNLVFMGMGEPFLNYDNFMAAVRLLVREVGLSPQRMTVSTSGIVPGIERFAQEPPDVRPKLAISLNAPNDQIRAEIMPINRKWPIARSSTPCAASRCAPRAHHLRIRSARRRHRPPEHAREVARLVRRTGLPAKVNLIAWNPGPGIAYATPKPEAVEQPSERPSSPREFPPTSASRAAATSSPPAASSSAPSNLSIIACVTQTCVVCGAKGDAGMLMPGGNCTPGGSCGICGAFCAAHIHLGRHLPQARLLFCLAPCQRREPKAATAQRSSKLGLLFINPPEGTA